ncbi:MAG TPA: hypothetical protein VHQ64_03445 [Pyrinomonadaceae bacterium]|jgi:hypothetical protein|nr:hypothetical protein [Pyrinomonadaceae bacterium]
MSKFGPRATFAILLVAFVLGGAFLLRGNGKRSATLPAAVSEVSKDAAMPSAGQNGALSYSAQVQKQAAFDQGADLRQLSTPRVLALSSRVVVAKCLRVNVREASGGIFTFSEFEVIEVLKGKFPDKTFTLRLYGGQLGNIKIDNSSMPQFSADEEVVLCLGADNTEGYPTVYPQGTFRIALEPLTRQRIIVTNPNGLPIFSASDDQPRPGSPPVPLEDFIYSIRKLLRKTGRENR